MAPVDHLWGLVDRITGRKGKLFQSKSVFHIDQGLLSTNRRGMS